MGKVSKPPTKKRNQCHHSMQIEILASKSWQLIEVKLSEKSIVYELCKSIIYELCKSPDVEASDIPKLYNDICAMQNAIYAPYLCAVLKQNNPANPEQD